MKPSPVKNFIFVIYRGFRRLEQTTLFFREAVKRLIAFHPDATIHVITDEDDLSGPNIVVHKKSIEHNHLAKLEIFGLLDRPAIYLDCDILINKPFTEEHCECDGPFSCFNIHGRIDYQLLSRVSLPVKNGSRLSAGMIYVKEPSKSIAAEMLDDAKRYFYDRDYLLRLKPLLGYLTWPCDEILTSFYVDKHRFPMNCGNVTTNIMRSCINIDMLEHYHSVHFVGCGRRELVEYYKRQKTYHV